MKTLKTTTLLLLCIFPLLFISCESDEKEGPGDEEISTLLIGCWQLIKSEGWEKYQDNKKDFSETYTSDFEYIEFNPDKSGVYFYENSNEVYEFEWKVKDKVLMLSFSGKVQDSQNCIIVNIDSKTLVLERFFKESDEEEYYEKNTYKKVDFSYKDKDGPEEPKPKCTCSECCECGQNCKCGDECQCTCGEQHPIVGLWEWMTRERWDEMRDYHSIEELGGEYYEFKGDYTGSISWNDETSYKYIWNIEDLILTIDYWEHYGDQHIHTIESITTEFLVLIETGTYENGQTWGDRQTYKRIK